MEQPPPAPDGFSLEGLYYVVCIQIAYYLLIIVLTVGIIGFLALVVRYCLRFWKRVRK